MQKTPMFYKPKLRIDNRMNITEKANLETVAYYVKKAYNTGVSDGESEKHSGVWIQGKCDPEHADLKVRLLHGVYGEYGDIPICKLTKGSKWSVLENAYNKGWKKGIGWKKPQTNILLAQSQALYDESLQN